MPPLEYTATTKSNSTETFLKRIKRTLSLECSKSEIKKSNDNFFETMAHTLEHRHTSSHSSFSSSSSTVSVNPEEIKELIREKFANQENIDRVIDLGKAIIFGDEMLTEWLEQEAEITKLKRAFKNVASSWKEHLILRKKIISKRNELEPDSPSLQQFNILKFLIDNLQANFYVRKIQDAIHHNEIGKAIMYTNNIIECFDVRSEPVMKQGYKNTEAVQDNPNLDQLKQLFINKTLHLFENYLHYKNKNVRIKSFLDKHSFKFIEPRHNKTSPLYDIYNKIHPLCKTQEYKEAADEATSFFENPILSLHEKVNFAELIVDLFNDSISSFDAINDPCLQKKGERHIMIKPLVEFVEKANKFLEDLHEEEGESFVRNLHH